MNKTILQSFNQFIDKLPGLRYDSQTNHVNNHQNDTIINNRIHSRENYEKIISYHYDSIISCINDGHDFNQIVIILTSLISIFDYDPYLKHVYKKYIEHVISYSYDGDSNNPVVLSLDYLVYNISKPENSEHVKDFVLFMHSHGFLDKNNGILVRDDDIFKKLENTIKTTNGPLSIISLTNNTIIFKNANVEKNIQLYLPIFSILMVSTFISTVDTFTNYDNTQYRYNNIIVSWLFNILIFPSPQEKYDHANQLVTLIDCFSSILDLDKHLPIIF